MIEINDDRNYEDSIKKLKEELNNGNRLTLPEVLTALSICSTTNAMTEKALSCLPKLKDCEAHSTTILSEVDLGTLNRLGIRVTEEPTSDKKKLYTKNQ